MGAILPSGQVVCRVVSAGDVLSVNLYDERGVNNEGMNSFEDFIDFCVAVPSIPPPVDDS